MQMMKSMCFLWIISERSSCKMMCQMYIYDCLLLPQFIITDQNLTLSFESGLKQTVSKVEVIVIFIFFFVIFARKLTHPGHRGKVTPTKRKGGSWDSKAWIRVLANPRSVARPTKQLRPREICPRGLYGLKTGFMGDRKTVTVENRSRHKRLENSQWNVYRFSDFLVVFIT